MTIFGEQLREYRKSKGLSQQSLAHIIVGVRREHVSLFEHSKPVPQYVCDSIMDFINTDVFSQEIMKEQITQRSTYEQILEWMIKTTPEIQLEDGKQKDEFYAYIVKLLTFLKGIL